MTLKFVSNFISNNKEISIGDTVKWKSIAGEYYTSTVLALEERIDDEDDYALIYIDNVKGAYSHAKTCTSKKHPDSLHGQKSYSIAFCQIESVCPRWTTILSPNSGIVYIIDTLDKDEALAAAIKQGLKEDDDDFIICSDKSTCGDSFGSAKDAWVSYHNTTDENWVGNNSYPINFNLKKLCEHAKKTDTKILNKYGEEIHNEFLNEVKTYSVDSLRDNKEEQMKKDYPEWLTCCDIDGRVYLINAGKNFRIEKTVLGDCKGAIKLATGEEPQLKYAYFDEKPYEGADFAKANGSSFYMIKEHVTQLAEFDFDPEELAKENNIHVITREGDVLYNSAPVAPPYNSAPVAPPEDEGENVEPNNEPILKWHIASSTVVFSRMWTISLCEDELFLIKTGEKTGHDSIIDAANLAERISDKTPISYFDAETISAWEKLNNDDRDAEALSLTVWPGLPEELKGLDFDPEEFAKHDCVQIIDLEGNDIKHKYLPVETEVEPAYKPEWALGVCCDGNAVLIKTDRSFAQIPYDERENIRKLFNEKSKIDRYDDFFWYDEDNPEYSCWEWYKSSSYAISGVTDEDFNIEKLAELDNVQIIDIDGNDIKHKYLKKQEALKMGKTNKPEYNTMVVQDKPEWSIATHRDRMFIVKTGDKTGWSTIDQIDQLVKEKCEDYDVSKCVQLFDENDKRYTAWNLLKEQRLFNEYFSQYKDMEFDLEELAKNEKVHILDIDGNDIKEQYLWANNPAFEDIEIGDYIEIEINKNDLHFIGNIISPSILRVKVLGKDETRLLIETVPTRGSAIDQYDVARFSASTKSIGRKANYIHKGHRIFRKKNQERIINPSIEDIQKGDIIEVEISGEIIETEVLGKGKEYEDAENEILVIKTGKTKGGLVDNSDVKRFGVAQKYVDDEIYVSYLTHYSKIHSKKINQFKKHIKEDATNHSKKLQQEIKDLVKPLSDKYDIDCSSYSNIIKYLDTASSYGSLWEDLCYKSLSEEFIREFKDNINWNCISKYQNLSEDFIREFKDYVNWYNISRYQNLSEDFIREFKDNVDWNCVSIYQNLSEDFIREFKDKVNWYDISKYQNLSEDFIREFKDYVNWNCISEYQNLSEDFIREFKDKVYWDYISIYQNLSENFRREYKLDPEWSIVYEQDKEKIHLIRTTDYEVVENFISTHDIDKNYKIEYDKSWGKKSTGNCYECMLEDFVSGNLQKRLPGRFQLEELAKVDNISIWNDNFTEVSEKILELPQNAILDDNVLNMLGQQQGKSDMKYDDNKPYWCTVLHDDGHVYVVRTTSVRKAESLVSEYSDGRSCLQSVYYDEYDTPEEYGDPNGSSWRMMRDDYNEEEWTEDYEFPWEFDLKELAKKEFVTILDDGGNNIEKEFLSDKEIEEVENQDKSEWVAAWYDNEIYLVHFENQILDASHKDKARRTIKDTFNLDCYLSDILSYYDERRADIKANGSSWRRLRYHHLNEHDFNVAVKDLDFDVSELAKHDCVHIIDENGNDIKNQYLKGSIMSKLTQAKEVVVSSAKDMGQAGLLGVKLAGVERMNDAAYNYISMAMAGMGIPPETLEDPKVKAAVQMMLPLVLHPVAVTFESRLPYAEKIKGTLEMSFTESMRDNSSQLLGFAEELFKVMFIAQNDPDQRFRIDVNYDKYTDERLRKQAESKGLRVQDDLAREDLIKLLREEETEAAMMQIENQLETS